MTQRIVLKEANGRRLLPGIGLDESWLLTALRRGDAEQQIPFELEFTAEEGDLKVTYVEDVISDCAYVVLAGADRERGVEVIKEHFEFWTDEELIAAWYDATTAGPKMDAILKLGVGAPINPREDFERALLEALSDATSTVREAAIVAVCYRDWPRLNAKLRDIADNDADESCRERAKAALGAVSATSSAGRS